MSTGTARRTTLAWNDIGVGDDVTPHEIPVTATLIVAGAIASRDYMPVRVWPHRHSDQQRGALLRPEPGRKPVACAAGRIGAACAGKDDDATCDTTPGAGDGDCDACPITAGITTENEMFVLTPAYVLP